MERTKKVNRTKRATSLRLTDEARAYLDRLANGMGVSQSAIMEMAVRAFAKEHADEMAPTSDKVQDQ